MYLSNILKKNFTNKFYYTLILVKNLLEGTEYDVQVLAKSIDDQQAVSDKLRVLYPGFKSIRAISTGLISFID